MDKTSYMTCELKVNTKSSKWEDAITRILKEIREVEYTIDVQTGIANISGRIDSTRLLLLLKKAGKYVQIKRVVSGSNQPYEPDLMEDVNNEQCGDFYNNNNTNPYYSHCQYNYPIAQPMAIGQPYYEGSTCSIL